MSMSSETILFVGFFDFPFFDNDHISLLNRFRDYLSKNCKEFYFIVHDSDKNEDNSFKTEHVHFLYKKNTKTVVATELNNLTMFLFDSMKFRFLITIDKCKSYDMSLRYLVHRDNPTKYQYAWEKIESNVNSNMINAVLEPPPKQIITIEYLIDLINETHGDMWEMYKRIGLESAMKYRGIIKDLLNR